MLPVTRQTGRLQVGCSRASSKEWAARCSGDTVFRTSGKLGRLHDGGCGSARPRWWTQASDGGTAGGLAAGTSVQWRNQGETGGRQLPPGAVDEGAQNSQKNDHMNEFGKFAGWASSQWCNRKSDCWRQTHVTTFRGCFHPSSAAAPGRGVRDNGDSTALKEASTHKSDTRWQCFCRWLCLT